MRKRIFLWLAIFCCLAFTVGILAACNGGDSTQTGGQTPADSSAYAGRYYEEVNGRLDADSWIELGDDWTWVDSDTMMGTFTVDGSSIHFYWVTASEPMFDGTISDGEFTVNILGTLCKYKQGTPSADTPEEPDEGDPDDEKPEEPEGEYHTVTFDVNGGEEAVLPHEYLVGALMSLPTPTREGYRFWGWFDELGVRYDNSSVMPNEDLTLTAEWKIIVTSYEDEYIYFKPATEGKKNSDSYYDRYANSGIHHYMYLELESDSIGGPEAVGSSNNLDLASRVDMDFSVADGYTLTWYNDSGFTSINGAQRFTLGYGSNIYFLTVSEGSRVVQRYLIDFYIKYDYYISLYSNIYEKESYNEENRVRVIEGEKIAFSDLEQKAERDFEFDNWVYFNYNLGKYVEFDFDVAIYKSWSLYQTFKPQTITANLNGGSMDEELLITPYTPYQQLPVPTKENYDFIGWQLADRDYFADITGYGSTTLLSDDNYFKSLKAEFRPKKYYKDVSDEGDTISFVSTIPVVFYTDESRAEIHEIYYLPTELLPYSPVPDAVPLTGDDIFLGWRSYYGTEEAEIFDFNQAIEVPTSVFPEFRAATYDSEVGIGNGYTFTSDSSFDTHHVTAWLPSSGEYILTVSGKAGISVAAYGEYEASSYTSTSSRPATIVLLCDDLSGRSATVTLKQTSGKVTLSLSGESGYSDQSQKIDPTTAKYGEFGKEVLLNARENVGGIFLGWYDEDDVQVSGKGSYLYMFTMPGNEVTYTAKWAKVSVVSEDTAKGTVSQLTKKYLPGEEVSVTATTNLGYTFIGWYNGDEKVADTLTYKFEMPAEDVTYTAKWIACPVNLEVSNADAGSVSMPTTTVAGERVAITATTNPGYTFIGWYKGDEKLTDSLTYEFTMPEENVTYTAKWIKVTVESEDTTKGTVSRLTGTYLPGEEVSITATTKSGYTFIGWYNGEEKVADSLTYEFTMPEESVTYTAKWIKVTVESEDTAKGTVSQLTDTYVFGEEVSVTATTYLGYTFIGWYNGDEKLTDSLTYEFTMPEESVTYTAKWIKVTVESEDTAKGTVSQLTDTYVFGEEVSVTATTNLGYTFIGWYNGDEKVADTLTYKFEMPAENVTYTAKWMMNAEMEPFVFTSTPTSLTIQGVTDSNVTSLEVPSYVTHIGSDAFSGCNALASIEVDVSNTTYASVDGILYNKAKIEFVHIPDAITGDVEIPGGVTSIANYAFSGCSNLTSITIPDSVTSIGSSAFSGCSSLESITLPFVGDEAGKTSSDTYQYPFGYIFGTSSYTGSEAVRQYYYGSSTSSTTSTTYYIPSSLRSVTVTGGNILYGAFNNCSMLTSITIPDSVTSIGERAFNGCAAEIVWGDAPEITEIGDYAFYGYEGTSITIPDSVTSIGISAFSGCSGLTSITIPDSVTSIGSYAFEGCDNLQYNEYDNAFYLGNAENLYLVLIKAKDMSISSVTIPDSTKVIYEGAFSGCSGLTSVTIPDSVTSIGISAFNGCSAEIIWGDDPQITEIGDSAFSGYKGRSITIPDSVTSIGRYAFYDCTSLESISIPFVGATKDGTSNTHFGYIFGASSYSYNDDYVPTSLKKVIITGGTSIGWGAFYDCGGLTYVTILDSVTSIGDGAFEGCDSLKSITIPFVGATKDGTEDTHFGYIFGAPSESYNDYYVPTSLKEVIITGGTSIGWYAFNYCSGLTSVTIPDSVTSIGEDAFYGCDSLTSVTIPDSVTSIGDDAFSSCDSLTSVTIPDSVTSIGERAFYYCTALTEIHYTGALTSWLEKSWHSEVMASGRTLYIDGNKVEGEIVIPDETISIPSYAFAYQSGITSVTIPDSVTSIGQSAFSGCSNLTSIYYAGDMTSWLGITGLGSIMSDGRALYIDDNKVEGKIAIPNGTTSIPSYAFAYQTGITSVTIPDSVTSIGEDAFSGCTGIASATMPTLAIAHVPHDRLQTVVLTSGASIEANAFSGCTSLTSLTIPDSVTSIGENAFNGCSAITSATMPTLAIAYIPKDSLQTVVLTSGESIEANAFSGCTSLTSLTIPDSVTSIGHDAFSLCIALQYNEHDNVLYLGNAENRYVALIKAKDTSITSVNIPDSTKLIYEYAFSGCSSLTSVTIPNGVVSIGDHAFENCTSLTSLTIPDSVTSMGNGTFLGCSGLISITIPDSVTSIGSSAFSGCSSLTLITIPDGVTSIGSSAFYGCSGLTSITIPESVTSIGQEAFSGCSELESITVEEGNSVYHSAGNCLIETASKTLIAGCKTSIIPDDGSVTSIGDAAFYGCSGLTSVIIPDSVTSIGDAAFASCSDLETVTIGSGVTSIGQGAFLLCNGLSSVKFKVEDGWRAYNNTSTSGASLPSSNLSNTSTAANYLQLLYALYYWEREVNE